MNQTSWSLGARGSITAFARELISERSKPVYVLGFAADWRRYITLSVPAIHPIIRNSSHY
jgi:hypothetical protein